MAAISVGAIVFLTAAQAAAQVSVSTVFLSSPETPGSPFEPTLNHNGSALFGVTLAATTDDMMVDGTVIVSKGDPVPLITGATWSTVGAGGFNVDGRTAVSGYLDGTGIAADRATVLIGGGLAAQLLYRLGETTAPGTSGHLQWVTWPRINGPGQIAFLSSVVETGAAGIWAGMPGELTKVALGGEPAVSVPGATYSNQFYNVGANSVAMNDSGQLAFVVRLDGAGITTSNDMAIYSGTPGNLKLIAREGDPVAGGGTFGDLHEPSIGVSGKVAFYDESAVYLDGDLIAKPGDAAPRGGTIESLSFPAVEDVMAFRCEVYDGGAHLDSYMVWDGADLAEVVREGDVAPGTGGDVFTSLVSNAVVNVCGQIAFLGRITGNLWGVWVFHRSGDGVLVALQGTPSPAGLNYSNYIGAIGDRAARCNISDNGGRYFNGSGQVVFRSSVSNGSQGLFRSAPPDLPCDAAIFEDGFESGDTSKWSSAL